MGKHGYTRPSLRGRRLADVPAQGERGMGEHGSSERGILTELDRHPLESGEGLVAEVSRSSYLVADVEREATRLYLVLLRRGDPTERLSLAHTRIAQGHLFLGPMSNLVSNRRRVLARICEDDVRAHDILSSCGADLNLPPVSPTRSRETAFRSGRCRTAWTSSRRSRSGPMARWSPVPLGRGGVTDWRCSWPRMCAA